MPAQSSATTSHLIFISTDADASGASAIVLRLPHELAQLFPEWLEEHYPLRRERVLKAIRSLRGGSLNDSDFATRFVGEGPRAQLIRRRFEVACRRLDLATGHDDHALDTSLFRRPVASDSPQLPLF